MSGELSRLVAKHGATPLCVPAVREVPRIEAPKLSQLLDELSAGRHTVVVFMTGVAVSLLFEVAQELARHAELVRALRNVIVVCRGPKPTAALRGFGVPPTLCAREPFTAAEVIDAMSELHLSGAQVLLFNYGERSETLAETLIARGAKLSEFWLYQWQAPTDTRPLEDLVRRIVGRSVDALAVTCQVQFRHLYELARRLDLDRALVSALRSDVVVAAVGPTCRAIMEGYGVSPHVVPDHPKMGPLVMALMRFLDTNSISRQRVSAARDP